MILLSTIANIYLGLRTCIYVFLWVKCFGCFATNTYTHAHTRTLRELCAGWLSRWLECGQAIKLRGWRSISSQTNDLIRWRLTPVVKLVRGGKKVINREKERRNDWHWSRSSNSRDAVVFGVVCIFIVLVRFCHCPFRLSRFSLFLFCSLSWINTWPWPLTLNLTFKSA